MGTVWNSYPDIPFHCYPGCTDALRRSCASEPVLLGAWTWRFWYSMDCAVGIKNKRNWIHFILFHAVTDFLTLILPRHVTTFKFLPPKCVITGLIDFSTFPPKWPKPEKAISCIHATNEPHLRHLMNNSDKKAKIYWQATIKDKSSWENIHIFLSFRGSPTHCETGKKFWIHASNIVCGGGEGLGLCELENAREMQKCPKTFPWL